MIKPWRSRPKPRKNLEVAGPTCPKISFEMPNSSTLSVRVELPETGDSSAFSQMLIWLNEGKLMNNIQHAIANVGSDKANLILRAIEFNEEDDEDKPLICPTRAIAYNIKRNQR